jgi:DNA-binding MurR/RpiR family transcriptional regulator
MSKTAMAGMAVEKSGSGPFEERLRRLERFLSPAALRVARFIDRNRVSVVANSAAELARSIGTSDATVVRTVQALGYAGLAELRQSLAASLDGRSTPADHLRSTLVDTGEDVDRAVALVLGIHQAAIAALNAPAVRAAISAGVGVLHPAERILIFGIGPSAPLARYVSMLLRRNGRETDVLDATGLGLADQLLDLRSGDGLIVLAYGRPYREVRAVIEQARRLDLVIVLVTDSLAPSLARHARAVIPAQRGQAGQVSLHAATLAALEALVLGLAACDRERALRSLERLNDLRADVSGDGASTRTSAQKIHSEILRDDNKGD